MRLRAPALVAVVAGLSLLLGLTPASGSDERSARERQHPHRVDRDIRVATFNASLTRSAAGELIDDLSTPDDEQARNVAETIQRVDPDIVLINEFDHDRSGRAAELFRRHYLGVGQRGAAPARYRHHYTAPSNTGVPSGLDLDNDGSVGGPGDAWGFGEFPGQYGMVVYSEHPIVAARTFRTFRWAAMPGNRIPDGFYPPRERRALRLSSKSHWDLTVRVGRRDVHLLASHPTPPVFDGPEDRNGRRNADEIRFWADYVAGGRRAHYIVDDTGRRGGLRPGARFVVAGDLNADPNDGDSLEGSVETLLDSPRVSTRRTPRSAGGVEQSVRQGGVNSEHTGDPAADTADFAEPPGNLRVDYVLPSRTLPALDAGVFWPVGGDPLSRLTGTFPFPTSDHRLVWTDLRLPRRR